MTSDHPTSLITKRAALAVGTSLILAAAARAAPRRSASHKESPMIAANKTLVASFIQDVWREGHLDHLDRYWTGDCINHADPNPMNTGLDELRKYHEQFGAAFSAFSDMHIDIVQQVAEGDRVVTQMVTTAKQTAPFMNIPAENKTVKLATIRIDRLMGGKIAEHWSVADMAGLMQQLQS